MGNVLKYINNFLHYIEPSKEDRNVSMLLLYYLLYFIEMNCVNNESLSFFLLFYIIYRFQSKQLPNLKFNLCLFQTRSPLAILLFGHKNCLKLREIEKYYIYSSIFI